MDAEASAEWIVDQIRREALLQDPTRPVPPDHLRVLRTPVPALTEGDRQLALHANTVGVALIRAAITRSKAAGVQTIKVRRGLRLPVEWEKNYEVVYQSNFPWYVSAVIQNAFLGNVPAGEKRPWTSR